MTHLSHEGDMPEPADGPHAGHPLGSALFVPVRHGHEPEPHGWVVPGQPGVSSEIVSQVEPAVTLGAVDVLTDQEALADAYVTTHAERARDARARVADALEGVPSRLFDPTRDSEDL